MYKVLFYEDEKGRSQVDDFLDELQPKVQAKVAAWFEKLEEHGPNLPRPFADIVRGKIRELRVSFGSNNCRFMYFFCGKNIVVTHGFMKKTDKVPTNEIERAERIMNIFNKRHKEGDIKL